MKEYAAGRIVFALKGLRVVFLQKRKGIYPSVRPLSSIPVEKSSSLIHG